MPRIKNRHNSTLDDAPPVRIGGRVKKAKIVFDPSVNNMPKRRGRAISMSGSLPYSLSDKSGDSPPKLKKIKTSSIAEQSYIDTLKKLEPPRQVRKVEPVFEPHISDCCMICEKLENKKERKLIPCKDCNYKAHPSCLKINFQNQNLLEEHWRCNNCTTCVVCYETEEAGYLITCCVCVDSYHLTCHTPKLHKSLNKLKWECSNCQNINNTVVIEKNSLNANQENSEKKEKDIKENKPDIIDFELHAINNNEKAEKSITIQEDSSSPDREPIKPKEVEKVSKQTKIIYEEEIPDISDWSCEKVFKYLINYFPREAQVLLEHEIDGASLLLMKRSDVIRGLPLKLGPAIRLYSFIVRLQSKSNDPRLTWM